nr:MAG TPA: hypothetical protein [Caudoviricetes sp.]
MFSVFVSTSIIALLADMEHAFQHIHQALEEVYFFVFGVCVY